MHRAASICGFAVCQIKKPRRRPIFPTSCPVSIVGAGGLNFRVRDGNGWDPSAWPPRNFANFSAARNLALTRALSLRERAILCFSGGRSGIIAPPWDGSGAGVELSHSNVELQYCRPEVNEVLDH